MQEGFFYDQHRIRKLVVVDGAGQLLGLLGQLGLMALLNRFCGGKERSSHRGFGEASSACRP
jgi:hypothetical protein